LSQRGELIGIDEEGVAGPVWGHGIPSQQEMPMCAHGSSTRIRLMMKLLLSAAVVLLWTPRVSASTIVDFTAPYNTGSWTTTVFNCNDGAVSGGVPSVKLSGCNDGSGSGGHIEFTHAAHADGTSLLTGCIGALTGRFRTKIPRHSF
jgi:hypothetical protein